MGVDVDDSADYIELAVLTASVDFYSITCIDFWVYWVAHGYPYVG